MYLLRKVDYSMQFSFTAMVGTMHMEKYACSISTRMYFYSLRYQYIVFFF